MGKVGVGIIGLGRIFEDIHLPNVRRCPDMELVGVMDATESQRKRWRKALDCPIYSELDEFLADSHIGLAIILTPSRFHHDHVLAALNAGKHVLVEKPMCMNYREALEMTAAAESNNRVLTVHHNRAFDGSFVTAARIIREGRIGKLVAVDRRVLFDYTEWLANYPAKDFRPGWRMERAYGGGQLYDWGPHFFDQALRLMGSKPASVYGILRTLKWTTEVDDFVKVIAEWEDGRIAELEVTSFASQVTPTLYCLGTEGTLTQAKWGDPLVLTRANGSSEQVPIDADRWQDIHDNLAAVILGKTKQLAVTPEHYLCIVELIDMTLASATSGQIVRVN